MTTDTVGLYVHIPFCLKKCNYCDFCSYASIDAELRRKYIDALVLEILSYKDKGLSVDTLFFGGGTPSLLSDEEFLRIVSAIRNSFTILTDAEFTLEANPKTLTREKLECYTSAGVNRISIGLQSIHENELKKLGRIHNFDDFLESYRIVRECGIDNVNIDLMYGIPEQTKDSFARTLDKIISISPEHISLYGLIIEEGTPFYEQRDFLPVPTEDDECDMYYMAAQRLARDGFSHYEISNYAKPGFECRHNLKYWKCREYIGVGVAAHSCFVGERFSRADQITEYVKDFSKKQEKVTLTPDSQSYEYVMLGLRLSTGISLSDFSLRFNCDFLDGRRQTIDRLVDSGLIRLSEDRLALTERGMYVSNSILTELL